MARTIVVSVDFRTETFGPRAKVVTMGDPTHALDKAYFIASMLLGTEGPWHFTEIQMEPPEQKVYNDEWRCTILAEQVGV